MTRPYQHINVDQRGEVCYVRLRQTQLDEPAVYEATAELRRLVTDDACRKMALSLGPESPQCLYSVFLARLIALQRVLSEHQGELVLCDAEPAVREIFVACCLDQLFDFVPNFDAARTHWAT